MRTTWLDDGRVTKRKDYPFHWQSEDIVVMKAFAHRPQDLADIDAIVRANPNLDRTYIEGHVREFAEALEMPELWDDIARYLM